MTNRDKADQREQDRFVDDPIAAWSEFLDHARDELEATTPPSIGPRPESVVWLALDRDQSVAGSGPTPCVAVERATKRVLDHLVSPDAAVAGLGEEPPAELADLFPQLELLRLEGPADVVAALVRRLERVI